MSERFDRIVAREREFYAPTARRWPLALVRGQGCRVWDVDGREYLDLTAGWGVTAIGHSHPEMVEAIADQARTLIQTTNVVYTEPQLELAEMLARIAPPSIQKSFFTSSGTEAMEGALKLAHGATGRSSFVGTTNSFHGRTLGALSVLGQDKHRGRYSRIVREAAHVPFGDLAAAKQALGPDVAAFVVEPIQGEGGVVPAPPGYLEELVDLCHAAGALLILDEIQTGLGRTGRWLALEHSGIVPDILTLGKGLGGGVPIASFMATEEVMATMQRGDHGGTYAGNLLTCRAAIAVLRVIERDGLVARAARLGEQAIARLDELVATAPGTLERVRGAGLLIGLVVRQAEEAARLHAELRERGVLVSLTADRVLRLFPALNIPEDDLERGLQAIEAVVRG
jgi:acetylornithine/N-succinyldiaminopimelate aminotransferase